MESLADVVALTLLLLGPVAGFMVGLRTGGVTRLQLVIAAALGGGLAGLVVCIDLAFRAASFADVISLWPWALGYCVVGAFVGLAGVIARAVGGWLGRRP